MEMNEAELTLILGFPKYSITRGGRVWSERRPGSAGGWLKPGKVNGYPSVVLHKDGQRYDFFVHRLVLETFVGPCPVGMESCHNNGDKNDNRVENLRWDTSAANKADVSKLSRYKISWIKQLLASGKFTGARIAKAFGVGRPAISDIKNALHRVQE